MKIMPWWCEKHKQHSCDDVCGGCTRDSYLKDFKGFEAGIAYAEQMKHFKSPQAAYDDWKDKLKFKKRLQGK